MGTTVSPGANIAPKFSKGIHRCFVGVIQVRIVEHLAKLVLFRSAVVIQRKQRAAVVTAGQTEIDGGLPAVTAYFQHRPAGTGLQGHVIQSLCLVGSEETLDGIDVIREVRDHR